MAITLLSAAEFREKIFDYEKQKEWNYNGPLPVIIDFYADWCGPCRMVAPLLEQLAAEYAGRVQFYKVDTEREEELSALFGIQSIPTFLFIPVNADPMMQPGAFPKAVFERIIEDHLLVKQSAE